MVIDSIQMKLLMDYYSDKGDFEIQQIYLDKNGIRHYWIEYGELDINDEFEFLEDVYIYYNGKDNVKRHWIKTNEE